MEDSQINTEIDSQKLFLIDYTDKSFIVYGEATKKYKDHLKDFGGRFNNKLKERADYNFTGGSGWIYRMKKKPEIQVFVDLINSGSEPNEFPGLGEDDEFPEVKVPKTQIYQNLKFKVFIPKEGMKVTVKTGKNTREGIVLRTETNKSIVDTVYLQFGEKETLAVIARQSWQIWGYNHKHTMFFEIIENDE